MHDINYVLLYYYIIYFTFAGWLPVWPLSWQCSWCLVGQIWKFRDTGHRQIQAKMLGSSVRGPWPPGSWVSLLRSKTWCHQRHRLSWAPESTDPLAEKTKGLDPRWQRQTGGCLHTDSMAAWEINDLGCHYLWHPGPFSPATDIGCQWRRRRGSLTQKDLKIHWSEAEIWFRCHSDRVSGPNKREWVDFFEGDRQTSDDHYGWPTRNQLPSSAHICNSSTLQCHCLSGQLSWGFRTHRLRSQWECGFMGLHFVDLQG